jgi:hypothetical protein
METPKRIRLLTSRSDGLNFGAEVNVGDRVDLGEALRLITAGQAEVTEWASAQPEAAGDIEAAVIEPPQNAAARLGRPRGRSAR